jgi:hypothetical protein
MQKLRQIPSIWIIYFYINTRLFVYLEHRSTPTLLLPIKLARQSTKQMHKYPVYFFSPGELLYYWQIIYTFKFRSGYIPTDSNIYAIIEYIINNTGRDMLYGIYQDLLPNQIVYLVLFIIKLCFFHLVI